MKRRDILKGLGVFGAIAVPKSVDLFAANKYKTEHRGYSLKWMDYTSAPYNEVMFGFWTAECEDWRKNIVSTSGGATYRGYVPGMVLNLVVLNGHVQIVRSSDEKIKEHEKHDAYVRMIQEIDNPQNSVSY